MTALIDKFKNHLTKPLLPHVAFQVSPYYLSGINVSPSDKKIKHHFLSPLKENVIQSSFNNKNILDEAYLEAKIKEATEKLHLSKNKIACLIPETCCKIFVFSFKSLPSTLKEREEIIRFNVKKQVPLLPDDTRLTFATVKSNEHEKVLVSIARSSVVQEYEDFFLRRGLKVRVVGTPTLSLFNIIENGEEKNLIIVNLEEDHICLMALVDAEISLYRFKPLVLESSVKLTLSQKMEYAISEIENTVNFIEDKEKQKIKSLMIRMALIDPVGEAQSILKERLTLPFQDMNASLPDELSLREKQILSPLLGNVI